MRFSINFGTWKHLHGSYLVRCGYPLQGTIAICVQQWQVYSKFSIFITPDVVRDSKESALQLLRKITSHKMLLVFVFPFFINYLYVLIICRTCIEWGMEFILLK